MQGTIQQRLRNINILSCEFDELSENNYMNQILKTTAMMLIASKNVKPENIAALKKCKLYFSAIDTIDPSQIKWDRLRYHRNNQKYIVFVGSMSNTPFRAWGGGIRLLSCRKTGRTVKGIS